MFGTLECAPRWEVMPAFRIFYFRHSVLGSAEEVDACDLLQAIEKVSGKPPDLRAEIWSDKGKAGIVGATLGAGKHYIDFVPARKPRLFS